MSIRGSIFILITIFVLFYTFRKPKIGLFYFLLLLFLRDGYLMENIPEVFIYWHVPMIAGWVILISWFFNTSAVGGGVQKPFEFILMIALGASILISAKNAVVPENSIDIFNDYIRMLILVFLIINIVRTEKDLKQMAALLVSLTTFLVLYAYYRYKIYGFDIAVPSQYYVDPNFFAESIVAILPLAFVLYENSNNIKGYLFLAITALMSGGVILTNSRGGSLALLIVLFFLFITSRKKIKMMAMGIIVLLVFLPHIGPEYKARMATVETYNEDASAMGRLSSWSAGLAMFKDHPIIGVGAGNFNELYDSYRNRDENKFGASGMSIHNIFLQILSETGMLGGGLFAMIIISSFISLYVLRRKNKSLKLDKRINLAIPNALGVSLLGFCGAGIFLPGAYYSYIYIVFALIMAGKLVYTKKIREIENEDAGLHTV